MSSIARLATLKVHLVQELESCSGYSIGNGLLLSKLHS